MSIVQGIGPMLPGTPIPPEDMLAKGKSDIYANHQNANSQRQTEKCSFPASSLQSQNGNIYNESPYQHHVQPSDSIKSLNGFSPSDQLAHHLQNVHLSSREASSQNTAQNNHLNQHPGSVRTAYISPQKLNNLPPGIQSNTLLRAPSNIPSQRLYGPPQTASTAVMYTSFPRSSVPSIQEMSGMPPKNPYVLGGNPPAQTGPPALPVGGVATSSVLGASFSNYMTPPNSAALSPNLSLNSSLSSREYSDSFRDRPPSQAHAPPPSDSLAPQFSPHTNSMAHSPMHHLQPTRPIAPPTNMTLPSPNSVHTSSLGPPPRHSVPSMSGIIQSTQAPSQIPNLSSSPLSTINSSPISQTAISSSSFLNGIPTPPPSFTGEHGPPPVNMGQLSGGSPLSQDNKTPASSSLSQYPLPPQAPQSPYVHHPPPPSQIPGPPPYQSQYPPPPVSSLPPQSTGASPSSYNTQPIQQNRTLNLDLLPSVIQVREEDNKNQSGPFCTEVNGQVPPFATTSFLAQDRGNCNPRFMRSTLYSLPVAPDVLKQTMIPFAVSISPFAQLAKEEVPPPICEAGDNGPVRCKRCKAYMCPFMTFIEGGSRFQCPFCKATSEVPEDYFCYLDSLGHRTDKFHRPELCLGSYEFLASRDYCKNGQFPNSPAYIFMIDVSPMSTKNGMLDVLCSNMKEILSGLPREGEAEASAVRVGFVTYNDSLHFYNVKANLSQPQMLVVSDILDVFVPILNGFLVTVQEAEDIIDSLFQKIPEMFSTTPETEVILGPVIQAGLDALKAADCPGKLFIFHSNLPTANAPGKLKTRDDPKLMGTDKEKTILNPQSPFYTKLAEECVTAGCSVDLFLFPNSYTDVATIGKICQLTGGQLHKYTYFQASSSGQQFIKDLKQGVEKVPAFDSVLRVRTSTGIRPTNYFGNFFMSNTTDMELAFIDCYKSVVVEIGYDDKMQEGETAYIQAALLYTSCSGQRRLRIHNLAISTCTQMADVYRCCEMDTIIQYFARSALKQVMEQSPQQIRKNLLSRSSTILACYRKNCANPSAGSQLILPERMKLFPLYTNCLLKNDAIAGGQDVAVDDRSFSIIALNSMNVKNTVCYCYPRLLALHDLDVNSIGTPSALRCSVEKIKDYGAYLLENGIYMFLWIGIKIHTEWLQDVFAVQTPDSIDVQKTSLMELNTPLSLRIREILENVRKERQLCMKLVIIRQGDKLDVIFRHFLVEDRSVDGKESYVEFVCHLHKEISSLIN